MGESTEKPVSSIIHSKGPWEFKEGPSGEKSLVDADGEDVFRSDRDGVRAKLGDAILIVRARSVPHGCDDPECPGVVNRQTLSLALELKLYAESLLTTVSGDRDSECMYCGQVPNKSVATEQHEPTGHLDHCIVPAAREALAKWQRLNSVPSPGNRVVRMEYCGCYRTEDGVWHVGCQDHHETFHPR